MSLLEVKNLSVEFDTPDGPVRAVQDVSFSLGEQKTLAIVGESGSGKSQTAFSIMGLLAGNGRVTGSVKFDGTEILNASEKVMNSYRAAQIAMIFQDPMTSLNPFVRVSKQMAEVLMLHKGLSKTDAIKDSTKMLDAVKIPDPARRVHMYPHEFSGGMRQRVMIAMSLLCHPRLVIADEPTTALDVTVQAQIMDLLSDLQSDFGMSIVLITHDLGVVKGSCENTLVLYGGRVMETGPTSELFAEPTHPYTRGLLHAVPRLESNDAKLATIPGNPPNMQHPPKGCAFSPRCGYANDRCIAEKPRLEQFAADRSRTCHLSSEELA
ncbi:oligopeptide/dipeptide ABC transporter ATP-binding protein [uncultured Ruegeria sp.]|uniref:oligopeptide/dipeptide ABC transporter ATP-binding protein n=1 Tax=uncultured Ruegeria sp. TaxID=259304 RepID=UPI00261F684A|nr:oligopeptide/dipeptide ABC transporter ATP-binding protein [uncultured Ruegeria sp.]